MHDEGKGLIVGHATGVAFTDWPEYAEMVGGYMDSEFNANAKIIVEDPAFPGAMAFGGTTFMFNDQHPVFKEPYSRDKVHVIMRLDPESLDEKNRSRRADGDFPVVWAKQYGKGRVFNVGWGHPDTTWDNPQFQTMMLEGNQVGDGRHQGRRHTETVFREDREPESRWTARCARQGAR